MNPIAAFGSRFLLDVTQHCLDYQVEKAAQVWRNRGHRQLRHGDGALRVSALMDRYHALRGIVREQPLTGRIADALK